MQVVLPAQRIKGLIDRNILLSFHPDVESKIRPASFDLSIQSVVYGLYHSMTPMTGETIQEMLKRAEHSIVFKFNFSDNGIILRKGRTYLFETSEYISKSSYHIACNPKSSIGRLDVLVRVLCDGVPSYDYFPSGSNGKLYLEVTPQSFDILVRDTYALAQMRFLYDLDQDEYPFFPDILTIDLRYDLVHEANALFPRPSEPIDVHAQSRYSVSDNWERNQSSGLIIPRDGFAIARSVERVSVPRTYALELIPYTPALGELRSHYAGFVDPGFGIPDPQPIVLELRSHTTDVLLRHGQPIAKMIWTPLIESTDRPYTSELLHSSYAVQDLNPGKQFERTSQWE